MSENKVETQNKEKETIIVEQKPKLTKENFPQEVEVKFITNTYPQKVTEIPFKVPSDLTRLGLSEIINHLLNHGDQPTPFEFLIQEGEDKVFLRTSLKEFFIHLQEYPENTIVLEYLEAQPAPKSVDTIPHDDWVSAVSCIDENLLITGCYDGICRIIDSKGSIIAEAKHERPIVDVATFKKQNNTFLFATAVRDQNAHLWKYSDKKCTEILVLKGHQLGVEALDFNPLGNMICTASTDKTIKIWDAEGRTNVDEEPSQKKKKTHDERKLENPCIGTLEGHKSTVSSIEWGEKGNVIFSGSYDHTIRLWDVSRAHPITTINGNKVVTTLSYSQQHELIVSGHPDYIVRTWDPRISDAKPTLFKSHSSWIRQVIWTNQHQFISCADDNTCKVWDIRSSIPLHSIVHNLDKVNGKKKDIKWKAPKKVLCVAYSKAKDIRQIFTGSDDCTLKKHTY